MSGAVIATSSPIIVQVAATALPLLLFAAIGIILFLRRGRVAGSPPAPPVITSDEVTTVPVRALYLRHAGLLGGTSQNSMNPRFAIALDGIHFKLFRESRLTFASIEHIDLRERFGRTYLLFINAGNPRLLSVSVADRATAKQVLEALPRSVALTPEAATVRDGSAAAATPGLRRYRGPIR
ncbi:hypothetical protein ACVWZA_001823 [Sphingomonas sp. UYAg733]